MKCAEALEPWRPARGEWNAAAAAHLLRRAGMGGTAEEIETALEHGPEAALEALFSASPPPDEPALETLLSTRDPVWLQAWWIERMLAGRAPLQERMTLVWHDHFATSNDKVDDVHLMRGQHETLRALGLGDFRVLLAAMLHDPAMLIWLDGDSNRVGHPNENLARELLELFALGIDHYTEHDVRETARALTGHGVEQGRHAFHPERHDDGAKEILGQAGRWTVDEVVTIVAEHPACARHVARKLLEAFVAPEPEEDWVVAVAGLLVESRWRIESVLSTLLGSRLFYSDRARRSRIAAPVECLVAGARALGARTAPVALARASTRMGQSLFRPPSVEGWKGGRAWLDVGRWIVRHNALIELVEAADPANLAAETAATVWPEAAADLAPPWNGPRDAARILTSPAGQMY